jgi:hypothetical protein
MALVIVLPACTSLTDKVETKMAGVKKVNEQGESVQVEPPKPAYGVLLPFAYVVDGLKAPIFVIQMIIAALRGYRG